MITGAPAAALAGGSFGLAVGDLEQLIATIVIVLLSFIPLFIMWRTRSMVGSRKELSSRQKSSPGRKKPTPEEKAESQSRNREPRPILNNILSREDLSRPGRRDVYKRTVPYRKPADLEASDAVVRPPAVHPMERIARLSLLARAVVYKEILDRPVSLRDEHREY